MIDKAKAGTIGGTLLNIFYTIDVEDLSRTIILAAVGAAVSFVVSYLLKALVHTIKK